MSSKKKASKATSDGTSGTRLSRGRTRPEAIFPVAPSAASLPESYAATLQEIKSHLRSARVRAILAANPIVIEAYWQTGKIILARQQEVAWGAKVIDRLAADLQEEFPDMGGLTRRNLFSMRAFAEAFPDGPIAKQPVSQLPWGQIIRLMQMVKDPAVRDFYIRETLAQGWSRSILEIQIQNQLHLRFGKAQKIEVQGTSTTRILTVSNSRPLEIRLVSTASRSFVRNCLRKNGCGSCMKSPSSRCAPCCPIQT